MRISEGLGRVRGVLEGKGGRRGRKEMVKREKTKRREKYFIRLVVKFLGWGKESVVGREKHWGVRPKMPMPISDYL